MRTPSSFRVVIQKLQPSNKMKEIRLAIEFDKIAPDGKPVLMLAYDPAEKEALISPAGAGIYHVSEVFEYLDCETLTNFDTEEKGLVDWLREKGGTFEIVIAPSRTYESVLLQEWIYEVLGEFQRREATFVINSDHVTDSFLKDLRHNSKSSDVIQKHKMPHRVVKNEFTGKYSYKVNFTIKVVDSGSNRATKGIKMLCERIKP